MFLYLLLIRQIQSSIFDTMCISDKKILYQIHWSDNEFLMMWVRILNQGQKTYNDDIQSFVTIQHSNKSNQQTISLISVQNDQLDYNLVISNQRQKIASLSVIYLEWIQLQWNWLNNTFKVYEQMFYLQKRNKDSNIFFVSKLLVDEFISYQVCIQEVKNMGQRNLIEEIKNQEIIQYQERYYQSINNLDVKGFKIQFWIKAEICDDYIQIIDRGQIIFSITFQDQLQFSHYNEKLNIYSNYNHTMQNQTWINIFYQLKYSQELLHEYTISLWSQNNSWQTVFEVPLSLSFYLKSIIKISKLQFQQFYLQQTVWDSQLIYSVVKDFKQIDNIQKIEGFKPVFSKEQGCLFGFFSFEESCFKCPTWNDQVCNECLFSPQSWVEDLTCQYLSLFDQNSNIVGQKYQTISYLFSGEEDNQQLDEFFLPISPIKLNKHVRGCLFYQQFGCLIFSQNSRFLKNNQNKQFLQNYIDDTIILENNQLFVLFRGDIKSRPDLQLRKLKFESSNNNAQIIFNQLYQYDQKDLLQIQDKIYDYYIEIKVIKSIDLLNLEFFGLNYNSLQSIVESLNITYLAFVRQIFINITFEDSQRYEIDFWNFNQMIHLNDNLNKSIRLEIKGNGLVTVSSLQQKIIMLNLTQNYKSVIIIRLAFSFVESLITINNFAQRLSFLDIHLAGDLQIILNPQTQKFKMCNTTYVSGKYHQSTFLYANVINKLEIYMNQIIFTAFNANSKDFILIETKQKGFVIFSLLDANFFDFNLQGRSLIKIGGIKSELYMEEIQIMNLAAYNSTIIDIQQANLYLHSSHIIESSLCGSIFFTFKSTSFKMIMFDYLQMVDSQVVRNVVSYKSHFPIVIDSVLFLHSQLKNSTLIRSDSLWKDELVLSNLTIDEIKLDSNENLCLIECVQQYVSLEVVHVTQYTGRGTIFCINSIMVSIDQFSFYGGQLRSRFNQSHPQLFYLRNVRDLSIFNFIIKDYIQTSQYAILLNNSIEFYQNVTFQTLILENIQIKSVENTKFSQQSFLFIKSNDIIQVQLFEILCEYLVISNNNENKNHKQYFINIQNEGFVKIDDIFISQSYQSIFNGSFLNIKCDKLELDKLSFRLFSYNYTLRKLNIYQSYLELNIDQGTLVLIQIYNSINTLAPLFNFLPTKYSDITFKRIIITNFNESYAEGGVLCFLGQSKNFRLHVDQAYIDSLYTESGNFIKIEKHSQQSIIKLYQIVFDSCRTRNNQFINIKVDSVLNIVRILRLTINQVHRQTNDTSLNCSVLQITHGDVLISLLNIDKSMCSQIMLHDIQYLMIHQILIQDSYFQNNLIEIEMVQDIKVMNINQDRNIWDLNEIVTIQNVYLSGNKYQAATDISLIDFVNFKSKRVILSNIVINRHEQKNNLYLINIKDYGQISNSSKTVHLKDIQLINNYCGFSSCMNFIGYFHSHSILLYVAESYFLSNSADNIISVMGFRSILRHMILINKMLNHKSVQVTMFPLIPKSRLEYCEYISQQGYSHFPIQIDSFYVYRFNNERIINKGLFNPYRLGLQINQYQFPIKRIEYSENIIDTIDWDQLKNSEAIYLPSGQPIQDYYVLQNLSYYQYIDDFRILLFDYQENKILQNDLICQIYFKDQVVSTGTTQDNWNFKIIYSPLESKTAQLTIRCSSKIQELFFQKYQLNFDIKTLKCQLGELLIDDKCLPCNLIQNISLIQEYCHPVSLEFIQEQNRGLINIKAGFWRSDHLSNAYSCNIPNACLGGWSVGDESCKMGHINVLCQECDTENKRLYGIHYKSNNQCFLCEYPYQYSVIVFKLTIIIILSFFVIRYLKNHLKINKLYQLKLLTSTKFYKPLQKLSININFTYIKFLIFYNQLIVNFQDSDQIVINLFLAFPLNILSGNLQCILTNYYLNILKWVLCVSSIITIFACIRTKNTNVEILLILFVYSLPSIFQELLHILLYKQILGQKYVINNFKLIYLSKYHIPLFTCGLCMLCLIVFMIFHYLFRRRNSKYYNNIQYFTEELKDGFMYWNIVKVIYQLVFIILCQFYDGFQLSIIALILTLIYTWLLIKFKPFYLSNIYSFEINIQSINILFYSLNLIDTNFNSLVQIIINYIYVYLITQRLIKLFLSQKSIKYHKILLLFWVFNCCHNQERALEKFKTIKQRLKEIIQLPKNDIQQKQQIKLHEDNPQNPKDWLEIEMPAIIK